MKTTETTYPEFEREAVNLVVGQTIGRNILAGIRHGYDISRSGEGNVLYINTVQTHKQLDRSMNQVLGPGSEETGEWYNRREKPAIFFETILHGAVADHQALIEEYIQHKNVTTITINSWELASKSYAYREELLYILQELTDGAPGLREVSVLVYLQKRKQIPEAGKLERGGAGKLAAIAQRVIKLPEVLEAEAKEAAAIDEVEKEFAEALAEVSEIETEEIPLPEASRPAIHQNGYSGDKKIISAKKWAPVLNNDVVEKKGVLEASLEREEAMVV